MTEGVDPPASPPADGGAAASWALLIGISAIAAAVLTWLAIPAALLLGSMLAGMVVAFRRASLKVPPQAFAISQGLLGCMIAKIMSSLFSQPMVGNWPLIAVGVLAVIAASGVLGWLVTRMRILPGTTAVWGLSPGAATVMTLMAESFGADAQLVAFMQYSRVILVAAIASIIAKAVGASAPQAFHAAAWFPPVAWAPLFETLGLVVAGPLIASRLNIRAGALLIPLVAGVLLVRLGWMSVELPRWLLAFAYAFIGWHIGLRFKRPLLLHALKTLPIVIACSLTLIAACGALAALFVVAAGVDPLTAYLATSPGGADTAAIIAASSNVDAPFVMTMQMLRLLVVLVTGPAMARFIATRSGGAAVAAVSKEALSQANAEGEA